MADNASDTKKNVKTEFDFEEMRRRMMAQLREEFDRLPKVYSDSDIQMSETMVPMSDGARLKTYLFYPKQIAGAVEASLGAALDAAAPVHLPVLFMRSCYPHGQEGDFFKARGFAAAGFACVLQYCRGTGGSEGEWEPNVHERPDGIDAIHWLAGLPWVESIGYFGASYLALTGWAMIDSLPDKVKGMYLSVYGTNRHASAFKDGLFRQDILTAWAMGNAGVPVHADFMESCRFKPQVKVDEALWKVKLPWYEQMICSADFSDSYWHEGFWDVLRDLPSKVKIPVVIEEGWYDHHLGSALCGYRSMSGNGLEQCLLRIGPWNHGKNCALQGHDCQNAASNHVTDIYHFFRTLLCENDKPQTGVSLYVVGEDRWINANAWPQPAGEKTLYLTADCASYEAASEALSSASAAAGAASPGMGRPASVPGGLCDAPCEAGSEVTYIYDPEDPVPSYGAESCFHSHTAVGSLKQPEPGYRSDVISFISQPMTEDMTIVGQINADLYVSSDAEDTAFSIKVMEIFENGEAYNIRSGITTLAYRGHSDSRQTYTPGEIVKINVDTWDIAWTIRKNSRIRVDISSSDFPQYSAHSNYAGIWATQEKTKKARQTIYVGGKYPSSLHIPLVH